jgi:hypothetical protein
MWEVNAMMFNGLWKKSDDKDSDNAFNQNPIKDYLDNVMKAVINKYSEPFPWRNIDIKILLRKRILMRFVQLLWF